MRYNGNFMMNFDGAVKSKDLGLQQDVILDKIATLIDKTPSVVEHALQRSGVSISTNASKRKLADSVAKHISDNEAFQTEISKVMFDRSEMSNADGEIADSISKVANPIASVIVSAFNFGSSVQAKKAKEAETKAALYEKIFGDSRSKTNWLPIIIIGAVLIIGGVVAYTALKSKD